MPLELVVVWAAVFAPLAGWFAARRRRSVLAWAVFGAVIGPLALALLAVAPPGTCAACGAGVPGWERTCVRCGRQLDITIGSPPLVATPAPASGLAAVSPPAGGGSSPAGRGPLSPVGPVAPPIRPAAAPASTLAPAVVAAPESAAGRGRRRKGAGGDARRGPRAADATVVATGVFISGTRGLEVGARYAIGILDDSFILIGPIDTAPDAIAVRQPRAEIAATLVEQSLLLSAGRPDRPDMALGFQGVAVRSGVDLEALFPGPGGEAAAAARTPA